MSSTPTRIARFFGLLSSAVLVSSPLIARAHVKLIPGMVNPRGGANAPDSNKPPNGPCGPAASNPSNRANPSVLTAGSDATITFEETINHRGYFELAIYPGGATQDPSDADFNSGQRIISPMIAHNDELPKPLRYSHTFRVPTDMPQCEQGCILRLVQWMRDSTPARPYYSCADIKIVPASEGVDPDPDPTNSESGDASDCTTP